jgi:hypothetical protein
MYSDQAKEIEFDLANRLRERHCDESDAGEDE